MTTWPIIDRYNSFIEIEVLRNGFSEISLPTVPGIDNLPLSILCHPIAGSIGPIFALGIFLRPQSFCSTGCPCSSHTAPWNRLFFSSREEDPAILSSIHHSSLFFSPRIPCYIDRSEKCGWKSLTSICRSRARIFLFLSTLSLAHYLSSILTWNPPKQLQMHMTKGHPPYCPLAK